MQNKIKKIRGGYSFAVSSDENLIYTAGGTIRVFDTKNFCEIKTIKALSNTNNISLSNNNELLAIKNTSGKIAIASTNEGRILKKISMEKTEGCNCLFTPDDKNVVDADWEGNIMLIELEKEKHKVLLKCSGFMIRNIVFNPNTEEFVFLFKKKGFYESYFSQNKTICLVWKYPFEQNSYKVYELPDLGLFSKLNYNIKEKLYSTGDGNGTIYFFDESFNIINKQSVKIKKSYDAVISKSAKYIVISADNLVLSADNLVLYSYPNFNFIAELNANSLYEVGFINDDKTLIYCGSTVQIINIDETLTKVDDEQDKEVDTINYFNENGLNINTIKLISEELLWEALYFHALTEIGKLESEERIFENALLYAPVLFNVMYSLKWFETEVSEGGSEQYFNDSDSKQIEALLTALKEVGAKNTFKLVKKAFNDMASKDLSFKYYETLDDKLDGADDLEELCIQYVKESLEKRLL